MTPPHLDHHKPPKVFRLCFASWFCPKNTPVAASIHQSICFKRICNNPSVSSPWQWCVLQSWLWWCKDPSCHVGDRLPSHRSCEGAESSRRGHVAPIGGITPVNPTVCCWVSLLALLDMSNHKSVRAWSQGLSVFGVNRGSIFGKSRLSREDGELNHCGLRWSRFGFILLDPPNSSPV